jgi:hypothetical protein
MSDEAEFHRTFAKFTSDPLNMWPKFKANPKGWNYRGQAAFEQEYDDAYAKKVGAFYAHQRTGKGTMKVRVMPRPGQNFEPYASDWEDTYSTLTTNWHQRVEPVVDDNFKLVGHIGWWAASEMLIPKTQSPDLNIQKMIDNEVAVFANKNNPLPTHYQTNYNGNPEWKFLLIAAPDGRVTGVLAADSLSGAQATIAPWEVISIGRAAIAVVGTGRRFVVSMVTRKGAQRAAAIGPTKELAETTFKAAESGTIHSVSVGVYNTPGHLVARLEMEQGAVVYRIAGIHLKSGVKAANARAAHRAMIQRAAQEAQKRGQKEFKLRGIEASDEFRTHANKLAGQVGVARSGRASASSSGGLPNYEVTLDTARVLASNQAVAKTAAQARGVNNAPKPPNPGQR